MLKEILLIASLLASLSAFSQITIQSANNGKWDDENSWSPKRVPLSTDHVLINHDINLDGITHYNILSLIVNNHQGQNTDFEISQDAKLTINGTMQVNCDNYGDADTKLKIKDKAELTITGNVTFNNNALSGSDGAAFLELGNDAVCLMNQNFTYNFNTRGGEDKKEINMTGASTLSIGANFVVHKQGDTKFTTEFKSSGSFTINGNAEYHHNAGLNTIITLDVSGWSHVGGNFVVYNATNNNSDVEINCKEAFSLSGNLLLNSSQNGADIELNLEGSKAIFHALSNVVINATQDNDVKFEMTGKSSFGIGGNLERPTAFGNLNMANDCSYKYIGTGAQNIASSNLPGSGSDAFDFKNIKFQNSSNSPLVLEGDLVISKSLDLSNGKLKTNPNALLIIESGAEIIGGGNNAYIEGPVKKIDIDGPEFTFPLGMNGRYAPMTLEVTGNRASGGEYTVRYLNCPPPWGGELAAGVQQISSQEHWTLEQKSSNAQVDVRLHWSDAEAQGITDLSTLVVAMYNPSIVENPGFLQGWTSIGNGGTTGSTGIGSSGSILNMSTCPPPWGIQQFAFGSTSTSNALPLNLESFSARLKSQIVDINWNTSNERNVAYYEVEKSEDGIHFEKMGTVNAKGESSKNNYGTKDFNPTVGINYYRVKMIDYDGMYAYSRIINVKYNSEIQLTAFPNPVVSELVIKGENLKDYSSLSITNSSGLTIYTQELDQPDNLLRLSSETIDLLAPGIYYLQFRSSSEKSNTISFVK